MYESHFGLTGTPFGLNPDPAFFFGSKGHSHALSYLKFGVYQGEDPASHAVELLDKTKTAV